MSPGSVLDRRGVMTKVLDREAESISRARELVFLACDDGTIHDFDPGGSRFKPDVRDFDPAKICGGKGATVIHTHAMGSGIPGLLDNIAHRRKFAAFPNLKSGCSAGIDGVSCIGRNGRSKFFEFDPEQESRILEKSGAKKWTGDDVFCDKIADGENPVFYCAIQDHGLRERPMGLFNEVSMYGGSVWNGAPKADVSMFTSFPGQRIECFGASAVDLKQLACILKEKK